MDEIFSISPQHSDDFDSKNDLNSQYGGGGCHTHFADGGGVHSDFDSEDEPDGNGGLFSNYLSR